MKKLFSSLLALALAVTLAVPAAALDVEDTRDLLSNYYVDDIPEEILSLATTEEILAALNDPYTVYMTAEEYQKFLSSVDGGTVTGIGVSVQTTITDGVEILSILPNSPALDAGLQPGDRILEVDGIKLEPGMDASSLITGEEGTSVTLSIRRLSDGEVVNYTVERRTVTIPIVTYSMVNGIGCIDVTSFGSSTTSTVEEALAAYESETPIWIVDLRNNPGGTTNAAAGSGGLFVGPGNTMVYFLSNGGEYSSIFTVGNCPDMTDKPLIVLTSPWSASGSELFAAAIRDYDSGIGLGQRTYGKGVAQLVFDDTNTDGVFEGDSLKVTAYRFFSPNGVANNIVGVLPSLMVSIENTPACALLMGSAKPKRAEGYVKLDIAQQTFYINLEDAQSEDYVAAFTELLEALPPSATLYQGAKSATWNEISPADLALELTLDYQSRTFADVAGTEWDESVSTLGAYQMVSGYADGTFRPNGTITRAEFSAMVATAMDLEATGNVSFSDVSKDSWYYAPITAMASQGLIAGNGDGTFRPDDVISYQEMVAIAASVARWTYMDTLDSYNTMMESMPDLSANYSDYADWARISAALVDDLEALDEEQTPSLPASRGTAAVLLHGVMDSVGLFWN